MPTPRNRLNWNATCKVYPAIADLQAIESLVQLLDQTPAGAGDNIITLGTVPADKLWVITSVSCYCSTANPTSVEVKVFEGVLIIPFFGQVGIVATQIYPARCNIVMQHNDELRFYWYNCLALDGLESAAMGYQIALY